MAQAHGGGHQAQQVQHLTYGQRELYRHARERAARRAALWDRVHAVGVRAAMVVGGLGVIAVVLVMLGFLGGCAAGEPGGRAARTRIDPGSAEREQTREERRPAHVKVTVQGGETRAQREARRPVVLVRVHPDGSATAESVSEGEATNNKGGR